MCSPTRASLLTGRNHHRIGNGQIAELANDWDGYAGEIPRSSALGAEVLRQYGYATAAFGKWHNTPAIETTAAGPFDNWPTGIGFEYFYGFLAGEASQYEPNLVRNTEIVLPPKTPEEGYHLSEDLADDAIGWLERHKAFQPDKPFFLYWGGPQQRLSHRRRALDPGVHPELRISSPYRKWSFTGSITRMPEFCAPALGNRANLVTIDAEVPAEGGGVLYALGGAGGGLTCYVDDGYLCYEYNLFIIMRTKIRSDRKLDPGRAKIEIETTVLEPKPGGPLGISLTVNGESYGTGTVPISAPLLFSANDCLDIGTCLGGPVSLDYYDRAPFPFAGTIHTVDVRYTS